MSLLEIADLHVSVETADGERPILNGLSLEVEPGQTHAIMGPNGSGKSTLAYALAGRPGYQVTAGQVLFDGADLLAMTVDQRARAGLFLAMQYPVEVPGVSVANFLRSSKAAVAGKAPPLRQWVRQVGAAMDDLRFDRGFQERGVNEGFSGGEKKRHEVLQLELLQPKLAVLDEIDSGLDVDALRIVSAGINRTQAEAGSGLLVITHYTRVLQYIKPDHVHVLVGGRVVEQGGPDLATKLEEQGYDRFG
ncbi:MAG: Fe-S cluster assembly ATPase SufC [Micrococcales bacterium]|nr:Fe-S cluster assembly ATPase SufC [Micrococcales bacterium]